MLGTNCFSLDVEVTRSIAICSTGKLPSDTSGQLTPKKLKLSSPAVRDTTGILGMLCIRIIYLHLICSNCSNCVSLAVEQQCVVLFTYSIGTPSDDTAGQPTPKKMKLSSPDTMGSLGTFCIGMVFTDLWSITGCGYLRPSTACSM